VRWKLLVLQSFLKFGHGGQTADKTSHAQEILVGEARVGRTQTLFLRVNDSSDASCTLNRILLH
jgi:hypothetical protein